MNTKKYEVRGREIAVLSLWHWRLPTGIFTCDGAVACSSWSMASCSFWVPSGYAQCLSSVHAPGCLEATLGHAKLDLIYSASQQGLLSWPHSRSPHASSSWKELPCVEPAGPASALNSYWPAEGHVKMLFVAFPKLQQHVALRGASSFWNHQLGGGFSSLNFI